MEQRAGAQISAKAFTQSVLILLALMFVAGILTQIVPAGSYARITQAGRQVIDPASFQIVARPAYPIWRWATAPVEVLWGPDGVTVITIILFLVMVGAAFAVLDRCGILKAAIARIVRAFGGRKYALLICLGLTVVSYPKWLKWTLKLWFWILLVTLAFLGLAVAIGYGPF